MTLRKITPIVAIFVGCVAIGVVRLPSPTVSAQQAPQLTFQNDQLREDFRPAKELLNQKGVPFDPEILLSPNWARRLSSKLAEMPEMHIARQVGNKIEGVQMADTLYLPEKVEVTGDTVIIANNIIFEGRNAVIKGNHAVYFFPAVIEGVLGTSLEAAIRQQESSFTKVSLKNSSSRLKEFVPRLLQTDWSLTIDTSGFGREEWLEQQKRKAQGSFSKVSFRVDRDTSGQPGRTGRMGPPGENGANGEPNPAAAGYPPFCGVTHNTGGNGDNGENGLTGETPGATGEIGGRGDDASVNVASVSNATGTHTFLAKGGNGGQGGEGGPGGVGGTGAAGGAGRDGLDCPCTRGGAGNGSNGGNGGKGGKGGNGGTGGPGGVPGNGNHIIITVPINFTGQIVRDYAGGHGGPGGQYGLPGLPGVPGAGGNPGHGATSYNCPTSDPTHDGLPGLTTGNLGSGTTGQWGMDNQGANGMEGSYTLLTATGVIGGCGGPPFSNGTCSSGFFNIGGICTRSLAFQNQCFQNGGGYDDSECGCTGCSDCGESPVLIDTAGDGFALTNAANGVDFDLNADGTAEHLSWTAANSNDAWLALDRNFNGVIDDGRELFGDSCSQPTPPAGVGRNGFLALADFDDAGFGGNADGLITKQDLVFKRLRLWKDSNHNGISDSGELFKLADLGLTKIELAYEESRKIDKHGNQFKYRAKVRDAQDAQLGRWAWDVFLIVQRP